MPIQSWIATNSNTWWEHFDWKYLIAISSAILRVCFSYFFSRFRSNTMLVLPSCSRAFFTSFYCVSVASCTEYVIVFDLENERFFLTDGFFPVNVYVYVCACARARVRMYASVCLSSSLCLTEFCVPHLWRLKGQASNESLISLYSRAKVYS